VPRPADRHPANAPGDWYIDRRCINCGASSSVAPDLIVERDGQRVFARQPAGDEEEIAAWRAALVCPTASIRTEGHRKVPAGLYPHELAPGVYRCGYNARDSYGAHSYFVKRAEGNVLVDSPRYLVKLATWFEDAGGIQDILLTHQDDVADADRYAKSSNARVWIHEADRRAAPFAVRLLRGQEPTAIRPGLVAIPVPGHTKGSVVFQLEDRYLFTGDSLAWDDERQDLEAFEDACWYSWREQARSLARLADHRFEWVLAGHGGSHHRPAEEMRRRLLALVERMRGSDR